MFRRQVYVIAPRIKAAYKTADRPRNPLIFRSLHSQPPVHQTASTRTMSTNEADLNPNLKQVNQDITPQQKIDGEHEEHIV
jgi:hypothetical protein